ncbi:MAG: hypothetical protein HQL53_04990 [Magnetococcales bacterium]|nr:hypothetical protein [Magnetococcales bacterium]
MRKHFGVRAGWLLAGVAACFLGAGDATAEANMGKMSFMEDVMPVFQVRCMACHEPGKDGYEASGLDLTSYAGLMKGTRHGSIVQPGNAMVSNLNVLVEGRAGIRMPHNRKRLTPCEIKILRDWVNQGAKDN